MSEVVERIEGIVNPLFVGTDVELVDVTYSRGPNGWVLGFFIDRPQGITLDDCQAWSERIGLELDKADAIDHAYSLEVSSPGLNRPLKKL